MADQSTSFRVSSRPTPPDSPRLADAAANWKSAYVRLPFSTEQYVDAVVAEIAMEDPFGPIDAINLGGGTPSRLTPTQLGEIVKALGSHHGLVDGAEISLEANPEDWNVDFGAAAVDIGFNRISLRVQSFDQEVLTALGRNHSADQAESAVREAIGQFVTVNIDLIYGTPGESMASWAETVDRALSLEPEHLSAHALAPDPADQPERYEHLVERAPEARLVRYEVSNWCRPGHHSRYHLSTWAMGEYIGFGLGAHDHRDGQRSRNVRQLDVYLERVGAGQRPRSGSERLSESEAEHERIAVGLRLAAGVVAGHLGQRFLDAPEGQQHVEAGTVARQGDRLVVQRPLLTDAVATATLSVSP